MGLGTGSVVVLGTGVVGLTVAVCLAESGIKVQVVADRQRQRTTSAMAGAVWGPYVSADPRALDWSIDSLPDLVRASKDKSSGVRMVKGVEAARSHVDPPGWVERALGFARCTPEELPAGYVSGWSYTAPVFDMPVYLDYLHNRAIRSGASVKILDAPLGSLQELTRHGAVIVNCTGFGARELVPDPAVYAVWGQLVIVENPGIDGYFTDFPESQEPTYFIAHPDRVILGGHVAHERTDLRPDDEIAMRIRKRCYGVEHRLENSRVLACVTGLRPARSQVRLEREEHNGMLVVHNYGHGGSGITMSWGCARYLLSLLSL